MKRIPNTMVSDEAKDVLVNWKKEKGFTTLDEALQDLLLEFKPMSSIIDEDVIDAVWPACQSQED